MESIDAFLQRFHLEWLQLNAQQRAAVEHTQGAVLLLAVPGSGKTTVLVTRLGYLLYVCGVRPDQVLTMTYTIAATTDMRARFVSFFGEEYAQGLEFRTINGVCAKIIQYYARAYERTPFQLVSGGGEGNRILRIIFGQMGKPFPTDLEIKDVAGHITYVKNMMLKQEDIEKVETDATDFPAFYRAYCNYMTAHKFMDYDDQMVIAYRILRRCPDILHHFQRRFPYFCVDEAQDTSKIQHMIIRLLAQHAQSLFMVGDEDQSI